jgi:hypothetical protein
MFLNIFQVLFLWSPFGRQSGRPERRLKTMTNLPFTLSVDPVPTQFLLTVRGEMAADTIEEGRRAHNIAAGSDQGVAMARSFGDLSHAVFVPVEPNGAGAGELLIIDYWNSVDGLQSFFASEPVQQGGAKVYRQREAVVWAPSAGLPRFSLPAPNGRTDRWAGVARGPVASLDKAEKKLSETMRKQVNTARAKGLMSREWYLRLARPGDGAGPELIGLDIWFDADGMQEVYSDAAEMAAFDGLFTAEPQTSAWKKPAGHWVEW